MTHPQGPAGPGPGGTTGPGRVATFEFGDLPLRTVTVGNEPWFVVADACRALDLTNPSMAASRLHADDLSTAEVIDGLGRRQHVRITSESGLYDLIFQSRKPEARAFRRWVTHDVLPAIRATGRYESVPAVPQSYADALQLAADQARRLDAQAAELAEAAPKAQSWDVLASADGDWSVRDAAKVLSRDPVISVGERRLFALLGEQQWTYRQRADGRWRPYQRAIESGWLSELPSTHYHPRTGELVLDTPQVRVTTRGLHLLHRRLGGTQPLRTHEQTALIQ
ncbi:phage antirepressor [Salinispora arenicola]|uniref:phage antirepressor n=1 Tax=Salinispora arenicola TaxID=168697 RepID=UPI00036304B0|nr:phage antirepressor KilAC domain-containing protein [Salinispora arenicola]